MVVIITKTHSKILMQFRLHAAGQEHSKIFDRIPRTCLMIESYANRLGQSIGDRGYLENLGFWFVSLLAVADAARVGLRNGR